MRLIFSGLARYPNSISWFNSFSTSDSNWENSSKKLKEFATKFPYHIVGDMFRIEDGVFRTNEINDPVK